MSLKFFEENILVAQERLASNVVVPTEFLTKLCKYININLVYTWNSTHQVLNNSNSKSHWL